MRRKKIIIGSISVILIVIFLIGFAFGISKLNTYAKYIVDQQSLNNEYVEEAQDAKKCEDNSDGDFYCSLGDINFPYSIYFKVIDNKTNEVEISKALFGDYSTKIDEVLYIPTAIKCEGKVYIVTSIGEKSFEGNISFLKTILPKTLKKIGKNAFAQNDIEEIEIGDKVEIIDDYAFSGCKKLKNIQIGPSSVLRVIGKNAFYENEALESIILNDKLEIIDEGAFKKSGICTIMIPNGVERICENAFNGSKLVYARIGENVKIIESNAFDTEHLKYVHFLGNAPILGKNVFGSIGNTKTIIYREQSANGWHSDFNYITTDGRYVSTNEDEKFGYFKIEVSNYYLIDYDPKIIYSTLKEKFDVFDRQGIQYQLKVNKNGDSTGNTENEAWVIGFDEKSYAEIFIPNMVIYDGIPFKLKSIFLPDSENEKDIHKKNSTITKITIDAKKDDEATITLEEDCFQNLTEIKTVCIIGNNVEIGQKIFGEGANLGKEIIYNGTLSEYEKILYNYKALDESNLDDKGIYYTITEDYAVVGSDYYGDDESANTSRFSGNHAVIPDYVQVGYKFYKVRSLGRYAFYNNREIESLELGAFIGEKTENDFISHYFSGIWDCSLRNCLSLNKFIVDQRNNHIAIISSNNSVDNSGELLCEATKIGGKLHPIKVIKAGANVETFSINDELCMYISTIEMYAFAECSKLYELNLSRKSSETIHIDIKIGEHAFENTPIGRYATKDNPNTSTIDLDNVTYIGDYAFANCQYITNVINLNGFIREEEKLGRFAFLNCSSLEKISSKDTVVLSDHKYIAIDGVLYEKCSNENGDYYILIQYPSKKYLNNTIDENKQIYINDINGLPIKMIEAYSFNHSNLTNLKLGENVLIVGKSAFSNSTRLRNVEFSKNIVYIGMEILDNNIEHKYTNYDAIKEASNGNRLNMVHSYEQEVFDHCYSLSNICVEKDNLYYETDNNGILYNYKKTTLIYYPQGISRLTYTIPSSVYKIGIEAFENNTSIQRIIIPEGVKEVGSKAFNGCVNLKWIYFRSLQAPVIAEQVFNSTGALNSKVKIYCIPLPDRWYSNLRDMWVPYSNIVEKYNAIQELPNQSTSSDPVYSLLVIDSDGNSIEGMEVTVTTNNGKTRKAITDAFGFAIFTLPSFDATNNGSIRLEVIDPKNTYYDYVVEEYSLDFDSSFSNIMMVSKPSVSGQSLIVFENELEKVNFDSFDITKNNEDDVLKKLKISYSSLKFKKDISTEIAFINFAGLEKSDPYGFAKKGEYNKAISIILKVDYDISSTPKEVCIYNSDDNEPMAKYVFGSKIYVNHTKKYVAIYNQNNNGGMIQFIFYDSSIFEKELKDANGKTYTKVCESYLRASLELEEIISGERQTQILNKELKAKVFRLAFNEGKSEEEAICVINEAIHLNEINFKFDDLPVFDSLSFKVDVNKINGLGGINREPFEIDIDPDKISLYLNYFDDADLIKKVKEDSEFKTFDSFKKSFLEKLKASKNGKGKIDTLEGVSSSHELKLKMFGAIEYIATGENDPLGLNKSYIYGELEYKFEIGRTWIVWVLPVRVEFEFTAKAGFTVVLKRANEDSTELIPNIWKNNPIKIEIDFDVELRGGIGASIASIGIYGEIGLNLLIEIGSDVNNGLKEAEFRASFGIYLKVKLGFIKIKINKKICSIKIDLLASKSSSGIRYKVRDMSGNEREYESLSRLFNDTMNQYGEFLISEGQLDKYIGSEEKIINIDGSLYKFYIADMFAYSNSKGLTTSQYNGYNYLKLVYQKYESDEKGWSEPTVINDNIYNELEFDITVKENKVYILYTSLNEELTASNYKEACQRTILSIVEIDFTSNIITNKAIETQGQNSEYYKSNLAIANLNGLIYLSWQENRDNNIFGISNNIQYDENGNPIHNLTHQNDIYIGNFDDASYSELMRYCELTTVRTILLTQIGNKPYALIVTDKDCQLDTREDTQLLIGDITERKFKTNISSSNPDIYGLEYVFYENVQEKLSTFNADDVVVINNIAYLYLNMNLYKINITEDTFKIEFEKAYSNVAPNFKFVFKNGELYGIMASKVETIVDKTNQEQLYDNGIILFAKYNQSTNSFGDYINLVKTDEGSIVLDDNDKYISINRFINHFNYFEYENQIYIEYSVGKMERKEFSNDNIDDNNDSLENVSYSNHKFILSHRKDDLILENVSFDINDVKENEELPMCISIKNDSLRPVNRILVELIANKEVIDSYEVTKMKIYENNTTEIVNLLIEAGETIDIDVLLNISVISIDGYEIKITNLDETTNENDFTNNSMKVKLAYPDVMVSSKKITLNEIDYLIVMVKNIGTVVSSKGKLYIVNGSINPYNENTYDGITENNIEYLYELSFDSLKPGEYKYYTIELNKYYFTENIVTVYAKPEVLEEKSVQNNQVHIAINPQKSDEQFGKYKLTYRIYGETGIYETIYYEKGARILPLPKPERKGFTFKGWFNVPTIMPDEDITVYGTFEVNYYNILYFVDGKEMYKVSVKYGEPICILSNLEKEGYRFSGWMLPEGIEVGSSMPTNHIRVEGFFVKNTYKLSYYIDENLYETFDIPYGEQINKEKVIPEAKEGYRFSGWTTTPSTMPAHDVKVYGTYDLIIYNISYYDGNGVIYKTMKAFYGSRIDLTPLELNGYAFQGWSKEKDDRTQIINCNQTMPSNDINLYAVYDAKEYNLEYVVNGEKVKTIKLLYNSSITPFVYSLNNQQIEWLNEPTFMPAYNVIVYANNENNLCNVTYQLDGIKIGESFVIKGSQLPLICEPTKEGYTFIGWKYNDVLNNELIVNNDTVVDAYFKVNKYTIQYYINSVKIKEVSYDYGEKVEPFSPEIAMGVVLSDWNEKIEYMPAHNVILKANTSIASYKITYYVDDIEIYSTTLEYNQDIKPYQYIPNEGYEVTSWNGLPSDLKMPNDELKIYASTYKAEYIVKYFVDNKLYLEKRYFYGDEIETLDYIADDGYVFLGFNNVPSTMPSQNISIYGFTSKKYYKLNYYFDNQIVYSDTHGYNDSIEPRVIVLPKGYTFIEWDELPEKMPCNNVDVYAKIKQNEYSINYYCGNDLVCTQTYHYNDKIECVNIDKKEGYTFNGWFNVPTTMPDENINVFGNYTINQYRIKYYIGNEVYKEEIRNYGETIILDDLPSNIHKNFEYWMFENERVSTLKVNDGDIILIAKLKNNDTNSKIMMILTIVFSVLLLIILALFLIKVFREKQKVKKID